MTGQPALLTPSALPPPPPPLLLLLLLLLLRAPRLWDRMNLNPEIDGVAPVNMEV